MTARGIGMALVGAAALLAGAEDAAPVIWYTMDEIVESGGARTIANAAGTEHTLTLGSGCSLTNGLAGSALWFDGTLESFATAPGLALADRTITMLLYRAEENGPLYETELYDYGAKVTYPYLIGGLSKQRIHFNTSAGNERLTYYVADDKSFNVTAAARRGHWQHLAFVFEQRPAADGADGALVSQLKVYQNGALLFTSEECALASAAATAGAGALTLGNSVDRKRPIFGALDEVKVYAAALSAEEVLREAVRAVQSGGTRPAQLAAHWTMDEIAETDGGGGEKSEI